jgi:hypothetical protein
MSEQMFNTNPQISRTMENMWLNVFVLLPDEEVLTMVALNFYSQCTWGDENLFRLLLDLLNVLWTMASRAAAQGYDTNGSNFSCFHRAIAHCATAAPSSRVVAAFAPLRWLLSCLLPLVMAQNSQLSGCSRACCRTLRRQFLHFRH